jgi:ribosome recycling factor
MIEDVLSESRTKMTKSLEALQRELASVRTGRASPGLVEHMRVDYYGTPTPLNQIANISVPEARLIMIQPWDRGALSAIEKAIQKSDLGINPQSDGTVIRLTIPLLTEDRRKELVKLVKRKVEDGRVSVRNLRRDGLEDLRKLEHDKDISEDDYRHAQNELQKLTDRFIVDVDKIGQEKEEELLKT